MVKVLAQHADRSVLGYSRAFLSTHCRSTVFSLQLQHVMKLSLLFLQNIERVLLLLPKSLFRLDGLEHGRDGLEGG